MFGYEPFQPLQTACAQQALGLKIQSCRPQGKLAELVHSFIQVSVDRPTTYPVIPDGLSAIYVGKQATLCTSPLTEPLDFQLPEAGEYFGIRFFPGALRRLYSLDLTHTCGQLLGGAFLPDTTLSSLHRHLFQHQAFEKRVEVCKSALEAQETVSLSVLVEKALELIYSAKGGIEIEKVLASRLGGERPAFESFVPGSGWPKCKTFCANNPYAKCL